jgi:hypothetical protein
VLLAASPVRAEQPRKWFAIITPSTKILWKSTNSTLGFADLLPLEVKQNVYVLELLLALLRSMILYRKPIPGWPFDTFIGIYSYVTFYRVDAFCLGFRACGRRSEVSIGGLIPGERESGMG